MTSRHLMKFSGYDEDDYDEEWLAEVHIGGKWIEFDFCDKNRSVKTSYPLGAYLGSSKETRYDGVAQEAWAETYHFWTKL
jgi:hypothetical protein